MANNSQNFLADEFKPVCERRLLVVDDDEVVCQIVQAFLSHEGWEADTAGSIAEADSRLAARGYPVIICDVHLSGGTMEWLARVRTAHSQTQVIMFTGDPSISTAREAMQAGAYDYVTKPARREELVSTVLRAFDRHVLLVQQEKLVAENLRYHRELENMVQTRTEQLRTSERMYRAVFDRSVDAILLLSIPGGTIEDANIAASRLVGLKTGELAGRKIEEFTGTQLQGVFAECDRSGLREWRFERIVFLGDQKKSRTAQVTAGLIEYEGERHIQLIARDITDHLELVERSELMELELLSEQRLAAIGLLASGVAHNINTPLMGIYGVAQLIKMKHPEIEDIDGVIAQVDRINAIIRNLMWKSRQEQEASFQEIDLNQLLREELHFLQADLDFKHNVEKEFKLSDNIPTLLGRYSDFSQSLMNVVRNALDAMHGRELRKLNVASMAVDGDVLITVEDTGCGMSESEVEKIFMPFYTTKPVVGSSDCDGPTGTGLGLSTVQKLLAPYGARYKIESAPNLGTRFTICIPIAMNLPSAKSKERQVIV